MHINQVESDIISVKKDIKSLEMVITTPEESHNKIMNQSQTDKVQCEPNSGEAS
ncbi:MAG: hypothetical protein Q8R96_06355 [Bacteroidota bacterium]|nr:hypothetical protein [Bacteroidota bacterium]